MISLLKTQDYSATVRGTELSVKVMHKDVAIEYFQSMDASITADQVRRIKSEKANGILPIEYTGPSFPTNTNL